MNCLFRLLQVENILPVFFPRSHFFIFALIWAPAFEIELTLSSHDIRLTEYENNISTFVDTCLFAATTKASELCPYFLCSVRDTPAPRIILSNEQLVCKRLLINFWLFEFSSICSIISSSSFQVCLFICSFRMKCSSTRIINMGTITSSALFFPLLWHSGNPLRQMQNG